MHQASNFIFLKFKLRVLGLASCVLFRLEFKSFFFKYQLKFLEARRWLEEAKAHPGL